jgi:hypothetical protein
MLGSTGARHGPIAQRLEQQTHNLLVPGSNPGGPTKIYFTMPIDPCREMLSWPDYNIHGAKVLVQVVAPTQPFCGMHPLGAALSMGSYGNRRISNMV